MVGIAVALRQAAEPVGGGAHGGVPVQLLPGGAAPALDDVQRPVGQVRQISRISHDQGGIAEQAAAEENVAGVAE